MDAPLKALLPHVDGWVNDRPLGLAPDRDFWRYLLTAAAIASGHSADNAVETADDALARLEGEEGENPGGSP